MNGRDWLTSTNPAAMLQAVRPSASERKLRLFACACCDRVARLLEDARCRSALAAVRRAAEGGVSEEELTQQAAAALGAARDAGRRAIVAAFGEEVFARHQQRVRFARSGPPDEIERTLESDPHYHAACAASLAAGPIDATYADRIAYHAAEAAVWATGVADMAAYRTAADRELAAQCGLLRDLFGNPFRRAQFDAGWLTTAVLGVAQTAYDLNRFEELPILADALEDAGCSDEAILNHCRQPGEHVRGCWVVDAILGRS